MSDTPPELKPSLPFSLVNKLDGLSKKMIAIDSERVMKMAERTTGLDDWADDGFRARLDAAVDGLNEAGLNTTGLLAARYFMNWHLGNRLRVVDFAKRHPELDDVEIERPVVITGFFRTGTTFLHNVLAADPNNRVAKAWELSYPLGRLGDPLGDVTWRRAQAKFTFGFNQAAIPDQGVAHLVTADSYEEDFFLLRKGDARLGHGRTLRVPQAAAQDVDGPAIRQALGAEVSLAHVELGRAHGGVSRRPAHFHAPRHCEGARIPLQLGSPVGFETATQPRRQGARRVLARVHAYRSGSRDGVAKEHPGVADVRCPASRLDGQPDDGVAGHLHALRLGVQRRDRGSFRGPDRREADLPGG
ncbi:MAG: sulfotransferase [Deltaproteobacteria bacterium]|nr:sulfotransferase [Deltaproteobacteria bacterium]